MVVCTTPVMILIQETDNTSDVNIGHVSDNVNKLNITFLNVCGIKSKLLNPNFDLLIKSYDVLIFTETNTDEFDELTEEYTYFAKHRKKIHKKSGGIIVVFKNTLSKCLHFIKSDSEYVQWVEFTKCLNSDMLLGCVYIPPENSKYSSEEAFIEVEDELLFFSRDQKILR
jgi:hypothetical protein